MVFAAMLAGGVMLRKDRGKLGLDPVFGLQATRDSKAMDTARNRNISYDKRLKSFLKSLDDHAGVKNVKIITRQAKTKEMLERINPDPDKKIVTPKGLDQDQVKTVRLLRRGSLPSMSLQELDKKLSTFRMERGQSELYGDVKKLETFHGDARRSEKHHGDSKKGEKHKRSKCKLTEYKIKKKLYRGISKTKEAPANVDTNLVTDHSVQVFLPLYRRKSLVCEAYQRITSSDVIHTRMRDVENKRRCHSDSDISVDSSSTVSSGKHQLPNTSHRDQTSLMRSDTMPDIRNGMLTARRVQFTTGLQTGKGQELCTKREFENFLNNIKHSDKLPALTVV